MRFGMPRPQRSFRLIGSAALLLTPGARAFSASPVGLVESYTTLLQTYPLETKLATAAVLAAAGDAIAQRREPGPYDSARAGSFVLFDTCYRGGFQHLAFPWIIQTFQGDALQAVLPAGLDADPQFLAAIECTIVNQLVIVPVVYYPLFFALTGAVQGLTMDESLVRARERFVDLTIRNWKFWIPAQLLQFALLPEPLQVPYTCAMGLVWNVILSAAAGSARPVEQLASGGEPVSGNVVPSTRSPARVATRTKKD